MLWSGEGLEAMFASFPPNLAALLVQWLPWVFRLAVLFMIFAIVFRAWRALGGGGGSGGRHVRGSRLKTVRFGRLRAFWAINYKLRIGGVGIPRKVETQHLLMSGGTGVGKSNAIQGTLDAIRARGDRAILADTGAEAFSRFGESGDTLLNPFDARSVAWSPFAEMQTPADAERLAKSMVPDRDEEAHREWYVYSQSLIAAVLKRLMERGSASNGALLQALTIDPPAQLQTLVAGLPAQALFHEGAERMLGSVRGIVSSHLAPYSYLPKDAGPKSWSIHRHVREGKGWLWLAYRENEAGCWLGDTRTARGCRLARRGDTNADSGWLGVERNASRYA